MAKTTADLITILRNVTGRVDASDPLFTDQIMLGYLNDFYQLEMGQELRLKERRTWWIFSIDDTTSNPLPVDLQAPFGVTDGTQFTTIGPLIYINGFKCWWYEDPGEFYAIWPETQVYQPQRPQSILYYNNELTFRGPPDQEYEVKINAYAVELAMPEGGTINQDYLWRYVAYGAALDLLADYGEFDLMARVQVKFNDYKAKVYARTYQQQMNQRSIPSF